MKHDSALFGPAVLAPFLANELIDAKPWDPLLGGAIVVSVALVPLLVKLGQGIQRRRTERLRALFGHEYERTVARHGDRWLAERELRKRARDRSRRSKMDW